MPYISSPRREAYALLRQAVKDTRVDTIGELEYLFCYLADLYVGQHLMSFELLNSVVGAFESGKMEFYRTVLGPYEQTKRESNGDVWAKEGK